MVTCPVTKKGANIFSFRGGVEAWPRWRGVVGAGGSMEARGQEEWRPGPGGGVGWGGVGARSSMEARGQAG